MRHYECECLQCKLKKQIAFQAEPYPNFGDIFLLNCPFCGRITEHTRVLTRKTAIEIRKAALEKDLRKSIEDCCNSYHFSFRFLYQSVIITTPISDWSFDYHTSRITLYHESTYKLNLATGDYAKSHIQFRNRKMTPIEVIDYIASHDKNAIKRRRTT